eukprot:366028-Chlamydomonas_euryale.AAC.18
MAFMVRMHKNRACGCRSRDGISSSRGIAVPNTDVHKAIQANRMETGRKQSRAAAVHAMA